MLESDIGPGVGGEMDDIERELSYSSREASVGFVAFANLDMAAIRRIGDARIELDVSPRGVTTKEVGT